MVEFHCPPSKTISIFTPFSFWGQTFVAYMHNVKLRIIKKISHKNVREWIAVQSTTLCRLSKQNWEDFLIPYSYNGLTIMILIFSAHLFETRFGSSFSAILLFQSFKSSFSIVKRTTYSCCLHCSVLLQPIFFCYSYYQTITFVILQILKLYNYDYHWVSFGNN